MKKIKKFIPDFVEVLIKKTVYRSYLLSQKVFKGPFHKYDFQTIQAIKKILQPNSNWVDIGAHKGHILRELLRTAPNGKGFAFEPIPALYKKLQKKYGSKKVAIYDYALSDEETTATFVHVVDRPAISGLKNRAVTEENHLTEKIQVQVKMLDNIIPAEPVALIKIDVEGAEVKVLKGAEKLLRRCKPVLLFEFGIGGANEYGNTPQELFDYLAGFGYSLSILDYYLAGMQPLNRDEFIGQYEKGYNYFFIAY